MVAQNEIHYKSKCLRSILVSMDTFIKIDARGTFSLNGFLGRMFNLEAISGAETFHDFGPS